jgi:hypothetical protein
MQESRFIADNQSLSSLVKHPDLAGNSMAH